MSASTLVVFGDSLSDNGNLAALAEGVIDDAAVAQLVGPTGAVSDGPTWAAYAGTSLGIDTANYAYAAGQAIGTLTLGDLVAAAGLEDDLLVPPFAPVLDTDINLTQQVANFLADSAGQDLSATQAVVMIGGNDFNSLDFSSTTLLQDALATINGVVQAQVAAVQALAEAGTATIWLSDLPAAEFFPQIDDLTPLQQDLAAAVFTLSNDTLAEAARDLTDQGHDVALIETEGLTAAIAEDPTGFGLYAPYGQTIQGSDVADTFDLDQIAFYDDLHPSTTTHGIIGAFTAATIDGVAVHFGTDSDDDAREARTWMVFGDGGSDILAGGGGSVLFGGSGDDTLTGYARGQLMSGGSGNDALRGFKGGDVLAGGIGDDYLAGMGGEDVLIDSLGNDVLRGGRHDDTFVFTEACLLGGADNGANTFLGGAGSDVLYLVLSAGSADLVADAIGTGGQRGALADLGIRAGGIESIVVLEGREDLAALSEQEWYHDADIWGLV